MKDLRLVIGSLGFIGFVAVAVAKDGVDNPHWLSHNEIEAIIASEPPPPAPGSDADKVDVQKELDAQNGRTPDEIAEAKRDQSYSVALFISIVGPNLTPQADPVTFHFFDELDSQVAKVVHESKDHWMRPRPYQAHPDILHPLFTAGDSSYPSGHAMNAFAFAVVLGQIWPAHADAFLARARAVAHSRVVAGVHYTSDIAEGEVVGKEVAKELLAKPEFQKELQAAKAEVAAQK